jgi:Zn-dependent protease
MDYFLSILLLAPTMLFALTFHEYAHGWVANRLGDPTAKVLGRLSLNPLVHLDLFGTVLLPLFLIVTRAPFVFGWAKPVPIDPFNLRHPRKDMIWVGMAGPAANFLLALACGLIIRLLGLLGVGFGGSLDFILMILACFVLINLVFSAFNLIPIPPLDGSRVVAGLLPLPWAMRYIQLERFGMILLILLFVTARPALNFFVMTFVGFFGTLFAGQDLWAALGKLM